MVEKAEDRQSRRILKRQRVLLSLLILVVVVLVVIAGVVVYRVDQDLRLPGPVLTVDQLISLNGLDSLYVKRKVGGLLGHYDVVVISKASSTSFTPDSLTEFVFWPPQGFLYRFCKDTLTVYVTSAPVARPAHLSTTIEIVQKSVSFDEFRTLSDSIGYNGLTMIPYPGREQSGSNSD